MPSSPLNPPTMRTDLPVYPHLLQLIRVTPATVPGPSGVAQLAGSSVLAGVYYVAFTQQRRTDSGLPRDREPCLAQDMNGLIMGNPGWPGFYHGRLAGSHNGLPVYEIVAIGVSGPTGPQGPAGSSRVYGQAKASPALPGSGPRQTVNLDRAAPSVGNNLDVTLADDSANDRLTWTIDNLGIFGRIGSGATSGPRRRLNLDNAAPTIGNNLDVTLSDDAGGDELDFLVDNLGMFGRAQGGSSGSAGPRRRFDFSHVPPSMGSNLTITATDDGANDEIDFAITNLGMFARESAGSTIGPRPRFSFVEGTGIDITVADDGANTEIDVTISTNSAAVAVAKDWHYYRHVATTSYHATNWPVIFAAAAGTEYTPGTGGTYVAIPYLEGRGGTLDRIGIYVGAAATNGAGTKARIGIYSNTSDTNLTPNALVVDGGEIEVGAATGWIEATISQALTRGALYWFVIRFQSGGSAFVPTILGYPEDGTTSFKWAPWGLNSSDHLGVVWQRAWKKDGEGALAALPATFPASPTTIESPTPAPTIQVRYSA